MPEFDFNTDGLIAITERVREDHFIVSGGYRSGSHIVTVVTGCGETMEEASKEMLDRLTSTPALMWEMLIGLGNGDMEIQ